ncbi:MAG: hypothetical protein IPO50_11485 [Sphingomonadales bacterium]|nr:hypothetical protein [Sphingomonadales bacterium]
MQEIGFLPGIEQLQRWREDLQEGSSKNLFVARDPTKRIKAVQQFPVFSAHNCSNFDAVECKRPD